jgi:hypothetical protein
MIITQNGTGGTSLGRFRKSVPVARTSWQQDGEVLLLTSVRTGELLAEIDLSLRVRDAYDGAYLGLGATWQAALAVALGKPGYGYSWYAVEGHLRTWVPAEFGEA